MPTKSDNHKEADEIAPINATTAHIRGERSSPTVAATDTLTSGVVDKATVDDDVNSNFASRGQQSAAGNVAAKSSMSTAHQHLPNNALTPAADNITTESRIEEFIAQLETDKSSDQIVTVVEELKAILKDVATSKKHVGEPSGKIGGSSSARAGFDFAPVAAARKSPIYASSTAPARLELIDDIDGPPPPTGMTDATMGAAKNAAKPPSRVELIKDDVGPPTAMLAESFDASDDDYNKKIAAFSKGAAAGAGGTGKEVKGAEIIHDWSGPALPSSMSTESSFEDWHRTVESLNELSSPEPFNSALFESNKVSATDNHIESINELSPPEPFKYAVFEDEDSRAKKNQAVANFSEEDSIIFPTREDIEDEVEFKTPANVHFNSGHAYADEEGGALEDDITPANDTHQMNANVSPVNQGLPEVEAYLVEERDEEVFIATHLEPTLPWWKERRTKILLLMVFAVVAALAIALGVSFSRESIVTEVLSVLSTTSSPSVSLAPSSSPSACVNIISSQVEMIDLLVVGPTVPKIALDGSNMIIVVRELRSSATYTIFYSLTKEGWIVKNTFQEDYYYSDYSVAISGSTAIVGQPRADGEVGAVSVYEQNKFGDWEKADNPFLYDDDDPYFCLHGLFSEIDGDLLAVGASGLYLFRRDGKKWAEIDMLDAMECSIAGDTVAIFDTDSNYNPVLQLYKYDKDRDEVVPQDPIPIPSGRWGDTMSLSHYHLVYNVGRDVFVYKRQETNETYTFLQQLNVSAAEPYQLAIDKDVLVVGGENHTHIFSEQNGYWEETITLDKAYPYFSLSGRNLLAIAEHEVYSFNIERCTQAMPTQMPTLSMAPTICYPVEIAIVYDGAPDETSWEVQRIGADGSGNVLKSYEEVDGDATSYTESLCLQEGEYEFTIYDSISYDLTGDGISLPGHYNVTSNGALIALGGEFERNDSTRFSLPFVPASSSVPSVVPST